MVIIATLVNLAWIIVISKPALRVRYKLGEAEGSPTLEEVLKPSLTAVIPASAATGRLVTRLPPRCKAPVHEDAPRRLRTVATSVAPTGRS